MFGLEAKAISFTLKFIWASNISRTLIQEEPILLFTAFQSFLTVAFSEMYGYKLQDTIMSPVFQP